VPGTEADEKGKGEDRGEKEWKRKLRNKLERMGNEEVLRGSMMTEVPEEEESGWKRKLRNRLVKMGNEEILRGSMMAKEPVEQSE
jgi:CRISPR/Cas system type I-B associated protein Csh2 (Cas7 group RAMP superfamily)